MSEIIFSIYVDLMRYGVPTQHPTDSNRFRVRHVWEFGTLEL